MESKGKGSISLMFAELLLATPLGLLCTTTLQTKKIVLDGLLCLLL
jgi:hypothetical protein